MHLQPGTFFYGIDDDLEHLMFAGDRIIGLVIHPEESGRQRYVVLQSVYIQAFLHEELHKPDPVHYGTFEHAFQKRVRDYLLFPTKEKADILSENHFHLAFCIDEMPSEIKVFHPSEASFASVQKHQEQIYDDLSHYFENYLSFSVGYNHQPDIKMYHTFSEFQKAFLPDNPIKTFSIPINFNPFKEE